MQLGIGRGDSSRRVLGKKPVSPAELERAVATFRELTAGQEVQYEGQATRLPWAKVPPPVWIAGYGPKVLNMAGRVADGVILQFADPDLIAWCLGFVWQGAKEAGRDPKSIEIMAAAPVWVSDDLECGAATGAMVSGAGFEPRGGLDIALQTRGPSRVAYFLRAKAGRL